MAISGSSSPGIASSHALSPPNILLIITDDQAWSTFNRELMPSTFAQLVDKGALFNRFYVNTPICCPSRSQILTGLYQHHTGVGGNWVPLTRPTIAEALHDSGYRTMLSGKYLNSWPCTPREEFDQWVCHDGHTGYVDPTLNVNGELMSFTGYTSQIEAQFVADFVSSPSQSKPFFAIYAPKSPHMPADDPRYDDLVVNPLRGPSYDQETRTAVMPQHMHRGPLTNGEKNRIDRDHMNMAQSVRAVDDDIGTILSALGPREQSTMVFLLSDNGFFYGDHRGSEKWLPYEEAVKVPFIVRYPPLVPESSPYQSDALTENVDIAPTIAELAGLYWGADGLSLVPLLDGSQASLRSELMVEHCQARPDPCYDAKSVPSYHQIVTAQYSYFEFATNEQELYDLQADPFELTNLAYDPDYAATRAFLSSELSKLIAPPPTDTTIVTGPTGVQHARAFQFTYFSQSRFAGYECQLVDDGSPGPWQYCTQQPFVVGPLADGDYVFSVRGTSEDGDTDPTPASRAFSIHETGPHVEITSAPPLEQHSRDATFAFTGDPDVQSFQCKMVPFGVNGAWETCASGVTYTGLADGLWSFKVRGVDGQGRPTDPPAQWLFKVDHTGPHMVLSSKPGSPTHETDAVFTFAPDEKTTGSFQCQLDSQPASDCSSGTVQYTNLPEAKHTLKITATDLLGDVGVTKLTWVVDLTPPAVPAVDGPPPVWDQDYALFSIQEGGRVNFHCRLDGRDPIVCPPLTSFYGLSDGAHSLVVSSFDLATNESATVTWNWTQQTQRPGHTEGVL